MLSSALSRRFPLRSTSAAPRCAGGRVAKPLYFFVSKPPHPNQSTPAARNANYLSASVVQPRCRDQYGTNPRRLPKVYQCGTTNLPSLTTGADMLLAGMHRGARTRVLLRYLPMAGPPMETALPHSPPKILPPPQAASLNFAASANAISGQKR